MTDNNSEIQEIKKILIKLKSDMFNMLMMQVCINALLLGNIYLISKGFDWFR